MRLVYIGLNLLTQSDTEEVLTIEGVFAARKPILINASKLQYKSRSSYMGLAQNSSRENFWTKKVYSPKIKLTYICREETY